MKIERSVANQVFVDLGFKANPAKWDGDKIEGKLNRLPDLVERTPDIPDSIKDDPEHLINKICKAVKENKEKIELIREESDSEGETDMSKEMETTKATKSKKEKKKVRVFSSIEEYETGVPKKKDKKVKVKKEKENTTKDKERPATKVKKEKVKKEPGQKKGKSERDAFGSRVGSRNAAVNAMLSKKNPVSMKDIKDKMGGTFYDHLNNLVREGKVKKTDKGYVLA